MQVETQCESVLSQRREFCVASLKNPLPCGSQSRAFLEPAPDLLD